MDTYFGDNLYNLRKAKGISQEELAEMLGVSRQAVSKWERNEAYPDTENLIAISKLFGVTIDGLINSGDLCTESTQDEGENTDGQENILKLEIKRGISFAEIIPVPIVITIVYLLLGFLTPRGWELGWTLYVLIPVYYTLVESIKKREMSSFAYPVFLTFIFLLLGMHFQIWHPLWVIYLTIPVYYAIADYVDKE